MSVCATCLEPGIQDSKEHDCPGLGDITITRQLGRGLVILTAPRRARMALAVFGDRGWGVIMAGGDQINIADQVLYQVVGYDAESACLVLDLVEDWRQPSVVTFDRRLSEDEITKFQAEWRRRYGSSRGHATRSAIREEDSGA
ncbi:hypothetical protein RB200_19610 [Streptomyces sp. PmtG]